MADRPPPWPLVDFVGDDGSAELRCGARLGLDPSGDPRFVDDSRRAVQRHVERMVEDYGRVVRDSVLTGVWADETGRFAWAAAVAVLPPESVQP